MATLRLAMVAGLALVAVAGSVGLTPGRARPQPPTVARTPVAVAASVAPHTGCGTGSGGPGERVLTPVIGGQLREVRVHLPAGYGTAGPVPLLLNLHGSGSTAAKQEAQSGLDTTADAHTFIVAYPQAIRPTGSGFAWNIPGTPTFAATGPDDVGFLTHLVTVLRHDFCVDPARVYASGFSGGARMVSQLACTPGVRLAGIAVAGGLRAPAPCHPAHPLPVLAFHGTADLSNPFNGHGQPYWTYSVPEAAGAFRPNEIAWQFLASRVLPDATPAV
jgi:polyhydroxybutyrate depolymerase